MHKREVQTEKRYSQQYQKDLQQRLKAYQI